MNKIGSFLPQQDSYSNAAWSSPPKKKARLFGQVAKPTACSSASLANSEASKDVMVEPWGVAAAGATELTFRNRTYSGCDQTDGDGDIDRRTMTRATLTISRIENSWQGFATVNPYHDGHLCRKYGEKAISGHDFPRCYYKCTYSPCPAKKRVEQQSNNDPPLFLVTYQTEHTCNAAPISAHERTPPPPPPPPAVAAGKQFLLKFELEAREVREQKHSPPPPTPCINADGSCGDPSTASASITDACAPQEITNPAASAPGDLNDIPWDELSSLGFDRDYLMDPWY